LLLILLVLKPAATILCVRSGAPGGLFTPSLTVGAFAGRCPGVCLVLVLARHSPLDCSPCLELELFGSNHTGSDLDGSANDGVDWPGPIVHLAAVGDSGTATLVAAEYPI